MATKYPYLTRNVRPSRPSLVSGAGLEVIDSSGRVLLDLGAQTSNLAIGQSHPAVSDAVAKQVQQLLYASSSFASEPFLELSRRLVELAPAELTAVNLMMCNGSDAVETACKLARVYRWSSKMLAITGAWHGESMGTLAFSRGHRDSLLITDQHVLLSREPSLDSLIELIESNPDAAGVVIDPVGVSNGLFTRAEIETGLRRIRQLCTENDIILIFDEVQTFGFLGGSLFAAEEFGVTPDVLCIAKAIGGGLPLAGVLCRRDLAELLSHNEAEFTNGANPVSCAAALAFLDLHAREQERFRDNARAYQDAIRDVAEQCPFLDYRNHGFITTFRLREDRYREVWGGKAVSLGLDDGIILRLTNFGQDVLVKPSILIDPETSSRMAKRLVGVFRRAADEVARTGVSPTELRAGLSTRRSVPPGPSMDYFRDLLTAVDDTFEVRCRSGEEIEELTRRLPRTGVWVNRGFSSDSTGVEYEPMSGTTLEDYLAERHPVPEADLNGLLSQHQRALESAHANGVIIGGRWSRNAVVDSRLSLRMIDFELTYTGTFRTLAAFEELFALFDFGARIADPSARSRLVRRIAPAVFRRWPDEAVRVWQGIRDVHLRGAESTADLPVPAEVYAEVIEIIDRIAATR